MAVTYGLTANGFVQKRQSDALLEVQNALRSALGQNLNLLPRSVFGNIAGIFSEREALLWELVQAVYNSQNPDSATGTAVDNILALSNLRRLPAVASRSAQIPLTNADTTISYGLVLYGTPGTVVPINSLIGIPNSTAQFKLDASVTIAASVNAVQTITFSAVPTSGTFKLTLNGLSTTFLPYSDSAATIQAAVQLLAGFSGVTVSGSFAGGFVLTYAGSAGAMQQPIVQVTSSTLLATATVVNTNAVVNTQGFPAQAVGSATCTATGPNFAAAGALTVIVSSVTGWASVTNQLDCTTGSNIETDTAALVRRLTLLSGQANGPIQSIVSKVLKVQNVIQAIGFQNIFVASTQKIIFNTQPGVGFTLTSNGLTTSTLAYTSTAAQVQAALRLLSGFSAVLVTGSVANGFVIDFNGSFGGMEQALIVATAQQTPILGQASGFTAGATYSVTSQNVYGPVFVSASTAILTELQLAMSYVSGTGTVRAELYATASGVPTGAALDTSATVDITTISSVALTSALTAFTFSGGITLSSGVTYAIVVRQSNGTAVTNVNRKLTAATGNIAYINVSTDAFFHSAVEDINFVVTGLITSTGFTTGTYARPGKSFEIVALGGNDLDVATAIWGAKPAGIQSYGSTNDVITDAAGKTYPIGFSRPTQVPIYVTVNLTTDLTSSKPTFNVSNIATIIQDIVTIGNATPIGGTVIGFGSNGLIGAFNNIPGITSYSLSFGTSPSPASNANILLDPQSAALFQSFNVTVTYS